MDVRSKGDRVKGEAAAGWQGIGRGGEEQNQGGERTFPEPDFPDVDFRSFPPVSSSVTVFRRCAWVEKQAPRKHSHKTQVSTVGGARDIERQFRSAENSRKGQCDMSKQPTLTDPGAPTTVTLPRRFTARSSAPATTTVPDFPVSTAAPGPAFPGKCVSYHLRTRAPMSGPGHGRAQPPFRTGVARLVFGGQAGTACVTHVLREKRSCASCPCRARVCWLAWARFSCADRRHGQSAARLV